uniref:60S ribosomal protein L13 n=1 Tax=Pectinaria gouldii TaxID=260746 RepID=Q5I3I0_PECGU|nr:ribosomal protein L13 [Pectinaria gouldii]
MAPKRNNIIPNAHFHKDWQNRVKTWFNQPARKLRRRQTRQAKARVVAPRPVDGPLRPVVRCMTNRYNMKRRGGRGFSLDELKSAGIAVPTARSIGIAVDFRRRNKSTESLQQNVQRLKEYRSRVVLLKKNPMPDNVQTSLSAGQFAIKKQPKSRERPQKLTEEDKKFSAYATLKKERVDSNLKGIREKRAKEKENKL